MALSPIQQFNSLRGPVVDRAGTGFLKIGEHIDLIKESIIRLIFTRKGTRMGNLSYGTTIPDLVFTNNWEGLQGQIIFEVSEAMARWEPRAQFLSIQMIGLDNDTVEFLLSFIELVTNTQQSIAVVADFV